MDQQFEFSYSVFLLYVQFEVYRNTLKLRYRTLAVTSKKTGKGLLLISLHHFLHDFEEKCFSRYILLTDQISLPDCFYFLRYLARLS